MSTQDWVRGIAEAVVWYAFTVYFLYSITGPVNIYLSAFILLAFAYLGVLVCPWVRHTTTWRRMTGKEN